MKKLIITKLFQYFRIQLNLITMEKLVISFVTVKKIISDNGDFFPNEG